MAARSTSPAGLRPTRRRPGSISRPASTRMPIPCPISRRTSGRDCPTGAALTHLEAVAAQRYGAKPETVVAGPGSQALIQVLARNAPTGVAAALGSTYRGHAEAFGAAGVRLLELDSLDALAPAKVAIVVNPNNPDGRVASRAALLDLSTRLTRRGGWLIVDEAFADFDGVDEVSPRSCLRKGRSSCARSARPMDWRGFGSASPSPRRTSPRRCGRRSAPGRSAGRRSRSAPERSPIRAGARRCARVSARKRRDSMRSWR